MWLLRREMCSMLCGFETKLAGAHYGFSCAIPWVSRSDGLRACLLRDIWSQSIA